MKKLFLCFLMISCICCGKIETKTETEVTSSEETNEKVELEIIYLLDEWHNAASEANFELYFDMMAVESVFIGTDAKENWSKQEFMEYSQPYFDRGKAWSFSVLQRNIFIGESKKIAWFDELLDTQMGLARGSGVVIKEEGEWKVQHYVLSLTIPNEQVSEVTKLKKEREQDLMKLDLQN